MPKAVTVRSDRYTIPTVPLQGIICPRRVETVPLRVATNRELIDATADYWLAQERQRNLDAQAEQQTEARAYPMRPNRHDD